MAVLGSTVDPRLGAVSPAALQALSQAGAASGQMYANIGSSIAGVIQDQAQRKTDASIAQIIDEATIDEFDEKGERTGFRTLDQSKFRSLVSERKLPPSQANAILQDTLDAWKTEAELIAAQRKIDLDSQADNRRNETARRGQDLQTQTTERGQDIDKEVAFAGFRSREGMQEDELSSLERRLGTSLASQEKISSAGIASEERMTADKIASSEKVSEANNNVRKFIAELDDKTRKGLGFAGLRDTMTIAEMNIGSEMEMLERRLENATASEKRKIRADMKKLDKTLVQNDRHFNKEIKLARKELKQEGTLFRERLSFDRDLAKQKDELARDLSEDEITARFNIVNSEIAARSRDLEAELSAASDRDKDKIRAEQKKLKKTLRQNLKIHNDRMGLDGRKISIEEALRPFQEALLGAQAGEAESRIMENNANTEMLNPSLTRARMIDNITAGLSSADASAFKSMSPDQQVAMLMQEMKLAESQGDESRVRELNPLYNSLRSSVSFGARIRGEQPQDFPSFQQTEQAAADNGGGGLGGLVKGIYDYSPMGIANRLMNAGDKPR